MRNIITIILLILLVACSMEEVEEIPETTPEEPIENMVVELPDMVEPPKGPFIEQPVDEKPVIEEPVPKEDNEIVENIIYIREDGFYPENLTVYKGETITWISDGKLRRMACYNQDTRVFIGERLTEDNEESEYTFNEAGEYLCVDAIYGLRGTIKVKNMARPEITGAVVGLLTETSFLPLAIVVAMIMLGVGYARRKEFF